MENKDKTTKFSISEQEEIDLLIGRKIPSFKSFDESIEKDFPGYLLREETTIGDLKLFLLYRRWFPRWFVDLYYDWHYYLLFFAILFSLILAAIERSYNHVCQCL